MNYSIGMEFDKRTTVIDSVRMTDAEFTWFGAFIQRNLGIRMSDKKRIMLESRLQKRLRVLNLDSFTAYLSYIFGENGNPAELPKMIDEITTNKTDFFREPDHFEVLQTSLLPYIVSLKKRSMNKGVKIWSAGCATGEEPYSLAMVLADYFSGDPDFPYSVFGTDISSRSITSAVTAIYPFSKADTVPQDKRKKYLLQSRDRNEALVRIVPDLRSRVSFMRLNLMDSEFNVDTDFDIIFCRNVLIYFERKTQEAVLRKLYGHLLRGGFLVLGHSETLFGMGIPLEPVIPTVYRKSG